MTPEYTILGSFGELYINDEFMTNIQDVSAQITIDRQDIMLAGSRKVGYKYTSVHGEGSMRGYRVTSLMARRIANVMQNERARQWSATIRIKLNDPEIMQYNQQDQYEEVELSGCKWWGINLGWSVNQIIEEDTPFTFSDIHWKRAILGGASDWNNPVGYYDPNATANGGPLPVSDPSA
jgi:hypothetical protein